MASVGRRPSELLGFPSFCRVWIPAVRSPPRFLVVAGLGENLYALHRGQKTLAPSASTTPAPATSSFFRTLANASRSPALTSVAVSPG